MKTIFFRNFESLKPFSGQIRIKIYTLHKAKKNILFYSKHLFSVIMVHIGLSRNTSRKNNIICPMEYLRVNWCEKLLETNYIGKNRISLNVNLDC